MAKKLKGGDDDDEMEDEGGEADAFNIKVQEIDAYWLQRGLSKFYDDADTAAKLAEEVLETAHYAQRADSRLSHVLKNKSAEARFLVEEVADGLRAIKLAVRAGQPVL